MATRPEGGIGAEPRKSLEEVIVEETKEASSNSLESSTSDASDALKRDQSKFRRPLLGLNHKAAEGSEAPEGTPEGAGGQQPRRRRWFGLPHRQSARHEADEDALSRISEGTAASTHGRRTTAGGESGTPKTNASHPGTPGRQTPGAVTLHAPPCIGRAQDV